jgi:hypothetical protein
MPRLDIVTRARVLVDVGWLGDLMVRHTPGCHWMVYLGHVYRRAVLLDWWLRIYPPATHEAQFF